MKGIFWAASAATVIYCLANPAMVQAQDQGGSGSVADVVSAEDGIADIVVTAQRRKERLQDVPVAVSALSSDFITSNNLRSLQELSAVVPGLVTTSSVNYGSAPLSIRGIGGANGGGNVFADEPVAIYMDESYVSRPRISTAELVDVGGIEVLRGPQGVLFGRNSTAGALLIRAAEPTEDFSGRVDASATTLDEYRIQAALSGPLTSDGRILLRVAGSFAERGGWGTNSGAGGDPNSGRDWQLRGYLRLLPTDNLTIDLIGEHIYSFSVPGTVNISDIRNLRDERTNPTGTNVVTPYVFRPDLKEVLDDNLYGFNSPSFTRIRGDNFTGKVEWDLGGVTLNSVTNYRTWELEGAQDSDGTPFDPPTPAFVTGTVNNIGNNAQTGPDRQFSQELRLSSSGSGRFSWLVGGFYFDERNQLDSVAITNQLAGPGGAGTFVRFVTDQDTSAWAVFGNLSYELASGLTVSAGARYSEEKKNFNNAQTVQVLNTFDPPGPAVFPAGTALASPPALALSRKDTDFSPRIVIDYKATKDILLYASYSQGFKSGGFNAFRGSNPVFSPERIEAFEAGLKSDFSRTFRMNLSAFRYDYTNLQVRVPVPTGGVGIESAAKARSQGFEAEFTMSPTPGLRFDWNLAYLDAKFIDATLSAVQVASWVFGTNPAVVGEDVSGNRLTRAPKWQVGINGRYSWDVGGLRATVQGSLRHQSRVFFLETQQQQQTYVGQPWEEVDARIAIGAPDDRWEVSVFGRNLTDNRRFTQVTAFFGLPNAAFNEPRKFGVQFTGKF
jgi:iron complex outermembrane receptor protein